MLHEDFQELPKVEVLRSWARSVQNTEHVTQVEVVHEGMDVNEVFVASTLSGEQTVNLWEGGGGEEGKEVIGEREREEKEEGKGRGEVIRG